MNRDMLDEKDILELLNYVRIDDEENEYNAGLKMDSLKKKKLKKDLMKQVKDNNSIKKFRYKAAAAAIVIVISIGAGVPALAKNIPALKSIVQALDGIGNDHGQYEKYSKLVNKSVTDKGVTLTINEVLCDDSTLMIGYTIKNKGNIKDLIKTGKELIEMQGKDSSFVPFALIQFSKIDGKQADSGSDLGGKFLDDHTYINSETMDISNKNLPSNFNVDIDVKKIYNLQGNWSFKFSVSKDEMLKNTKIFIPNTKVKFQDATINVQKVSFSPINTSIIFEGKYNKEEYKDDAKRKEAFKQDIVMGNILYDQWFVFDDKGNEITPKGSSGNAIENSSSSDFRYDLKFVSLKSIPKYLTVIPYRIIYNKDNDGKLIPPVYKNIEGHYPVELSQGKIGKLIIKDVKTEKDKTIVRYTAEGEAPFFQAKELSIMDEKDKIVERKDNNFEAKKDKDNPNDYIMEFEPLDKNKKYRIGTNTNDDMEIRNDLKFKIELNK